MLLTCSAICIRFFSKADIKQLQYDFKELYRCFFCGTADDPGALGLPDIGQLFPDNDPDWSGADSSIFMEEAYRRMDDRYVCACFLPLNGTFAAFRTLILIFHPVGCVRRARRTEPLARGLPGLFGRCLSSV